jgi:hypothetical protein
MWSAYCLVCLKPWKQESMISLVEDGKMGWRRDGDGMEIGIGVGYIDPLLLLCILLYTVSYCLI